MGGLDGLALGSATGRLDGLPKITGELVGLLLGITEGRARTSYFEICRVHFYGDGWRIQCNKTTLLKVLFTKKLFVLSYICSALRSRRLQDIVLMCNPSSSARAKLFAVCEMKMSRWVRLLLIP